MIKYIQMTNYAGGALIYTGYFDGASRGNPGEAAIGCCLINDKGEIISETSQRIGSKTNNEAEYLALITLLEEIKRRDIKEAKLYGDSQLVINQVSGKWRINHLHLYDLCHQVLKLIQGMRVSLIWIPREENAYADWLSNQAFTVEAKRKEFDSSNLERIAEFIFIAHGTEDYAVDVLHKSCSCPAFKNRKGDCKHLIAAQKVVKATIQEDGNVNNR